MTDSAPDPQDRRSEPLMTRAGVVAFAGAVLTCATAFGLDLTAAQTAGLMGVVTVAAPLLVAWWARGHVWSPRRVNALLGRSRRRMEN